MKILLLTRPICPPWDEGSKNFAFTLANNVHNAEIHILTCGALENLPKNVIQHPIYSSPKLNLAQKIKLFWFLKKMDGFDIIHSLFTPTKINSFFIKRAIKTKNSKIIQTVATLREDLYKEDDFKKILFGDLIITYSDYAREKIEKTGISDVRRVYPGIDVSKYSPQEKSAVLMEKYGITSQDFVINFTGEYTRLGAIEDVISCFLDLADENSSFKLQLACRIKNEKDARKKEEVKKRLEIAGILDRVLFFDDQKFEMPDVYNLSDVSIFPVRTMDGKFDIPLAVIEAMACEKPMIASSLERLKYFLNDSNCILIKPGDREALKEKILHLYKNPEVRNELGGKGMRFVRENFDIMKIVGEYEKIYLEIGGSKH
ncbi:MAG: glycosyltransferase family 4 protein [Parcubacteria group bacterium]